MSSRSFDPLNGALTKIAKRDHSHWEIEQYFKKKGLSPQEISSALEELVELRALDDERFKRSYFLELVRKGWGPLGVQFKMRSRGIEFSQGDYQKLRGEEFGDQEPDEFEVARLQELIERKLRRGLTHSKPITWEKKEKIKRHLVSRGFSLGLINQALEAPST